MSPQVGALITSAPGAGKTLVGTEIARRLGAKVVLIVAPQGTHKGAWDRTVKRQGLNPDGVRVLKGDAKGKAAWADLMWSIPGVYITTPQWFARQKWDKIVPDMVIFDEIHQAGSHGNVTQKKLHELKSPLRLGMSGTPLRNKFENAWAIVRWIEPTKMPLAFWMWRISKCETVYDRFAPQQRRVIGEVNQGELFDSLTCYITHSQRTRCCDFHPNGFLAELPAPLLIERVVEMTAAQKRFYGEMEAALASTLETPDDEGRLPVVTDLPIVARGMLRFCAIALPVVDPETEKLQLPLDTPSPKVDALLEDMETFEGKRVLVLTHSNQAARLLIHRIEQAGHTVAGWHGQITGKRREKTLEAFMAGELEVIVGVISAIGTGTDGMQEVCNTLCWISLDEDPTNNVQGVGRADRLGQNKQVVQYEYQSAGTIDVGMRSKQLERIFALNKSLRLEEV